MILPFISIGIRSHLGVIQSWFDSRIARIHYYGTRTCPFLSLQGDIVAYIACVAGGRHGLSLLALNSLIQAFNVTTVLRDRVEYSPFQQAVAAAYLATV
jgi:hypothetical protein